MRTAYLHKKNYSWSANKQQADTKSGTQKQNILSNMHTAYLHTKINPDLPTNNRQTLTAVQHCSKYPSNKSNILDSPSTDWDQVQSWSQAGRRRCPQAPQSLFTGYTKHLAAVVAFSLLARIVGESSTIHSLCALFFFGGRGSKWKLACTH